MKVESVFTVPIGWTFLENIDLDELIDYGHKQLVPEKNQSMANGLYQIQFQSLNKLESKQFIKK